MGARGGGWRRVRHFWPPHGFSQRANHQSRSWSSFSWMENRVKQITDAERACVDFSESKTDSEQAESDWFKNKHPYLKKVKEKEKSHESGEWTEQTLTCVQVCSDVPVQACSWTDLAALCSASLLLLLPPSPVSSAPWGSPTTSTRRHMAAAAPPAGQVSALQVLCICLKALIVNVCVLKCL